MTSIDDDGLGKTAANYVPLSPLSFLGRASAVFPGRAAVIYGAERLSWRDVHERAARLASALTRRGVSTGDRVAVLLPNTPPMVVAHFGVPLAGAVLNAVNTRLDAETIAYILEHGEAKVDAKTVMMQADQLHWRADAAAISHTRFPRPKAILACAACWRTVALRVELQFCPRRAPIQRRL
mgnify:CR=1 FL=1